jgi:hypothetical protein
VKWSPGALAIGVVATLLLAGGAWLVLRDPQPSYADRVQVICEDAYDELAESTGTYFEAVVLISSLKHQDLMQLEPPPEHAAFHEDLERREHAMFEAARLAQERLTQAQSLGASAGVAEGDFHALRAAQAELDGVYRELGIEHCSD